ncbi:unnamed protein product [Chondrus crispus]|uniref:Nucleolar protein 6 n=1 Tax=Chondrus crispus TaxID=2769 RepID=R7Q387_CHOCR|nr:unnamed protein product [Chondrus crispus]CDF32997.1 unnamed protein product [Chondrus crispus]|eukprot:XP_005712800.1 unnamed protein product [Chondrus crispus]
MHHLRHRPPATRKCAPLPSPFPVALPTRLRPTPSHSADLAVTPAMSPGQPRPDRALKRRRTSYDELETVKHASHTGDALTSPALSAALSDLLQARRLSDAARAGIEDALKKVKKSLDALPKKKTLQLDSPAVRNVLRKVAKGRRDSLCRSGVVQELVCTPPGRVDLVGSFLLKCATKPVVDVAVEMPADLFQTRDYRAYRYHDKRLLYLVYLARQFVKTEEEAYAEVSLVMSFLNGDEAKPVLCVTHVDHPEVNVRLLPTYPHDVFANHHLGEEKVHIREGPDSENAKPSPATIAYNASILIDTTLVANLQALYAVVAGAPAFADTVMLLEAWCVRHRLYKSNFVSIALLANLIKKGAAPSRAPREQLFRCALSAISAGGLKALRLGDMRVCASFDAGFLERCAECATMAIYVIESKAAETDPWVGILPFLFTQARGSKCVARPLCTLFDGFVKILGGNEASSALTAQKHLHVLKRALVDTHRAKRIERLEGGLFGFTLSLAKDANRRVDMRPESWDAPSFMAFWGKKANVRSFENGKIVEALVWSGGSRTLQEMTSYAFEKHFGDDVKVQVILGDLEEASGSDAHYEASATRAIAGFNELAKLLRSLEGVVLGIRGVHATSSHLRRCGIPSKGFAQTGGIRHAYPLDIVATFETSAAWPDNPVAICAAKASFYVSLKGALAEKGIASNSTISFLDITLSEFVYRLRIKVDKEKDLLIDSPATYEGVVWETEKRVRHHDNMSCLGNPLIGSVARMAKKWLNSHLMLSQMGSRGEELVEVLVASMMLRPEVSKRKSVLGYFCQFLHFLSDFPWEVCPLAVLMEDEEARELSKDMSDRLEEVETFRERVQDRFSRKCDGRTFFSVYNVWDRDENEAGTFFGQGYGPETSIAKMIVASAGSALRHIEDSVTKAGAGKTMKSLFTPYLGVYDLVLELNRELVPFREEASRKGPFHGRGSAFVGFDTVQMLRNKLEIRLGEFALFTTEVCVRAEIYVVWRPEASGSCAFSLARAPFREPVGETKTLKADRMEMVAEMVSLGKGLIRNVRYIEKEGGK